MTTILARNYNQRIHIQAEAIMNNTGKTTRNDAIVDCGWGRVVFAHTFEDPASIALEMQNEQPGKRDIAAYVNDPHIVLSYAPQQLFLDPSDTLRLDLSDPPGKMQADGIKIHRVRKKTEAGAINDLYLKRGMVPSDTDFIWQQRQSEEIIYLVAEDMTSGDVMGTVMGLDHKAIFDDPDNGSSLWCLAVDPAAALPGIGEALVRRLARHFERSGKDYMDLSVIHNNRQAKALYEKLGFKPQQYFAVKIKNAHNEALFLGPELEEKLNPYCRIIVDEARSRGISVEVLDDEEGYFKLSRGGKSVVCRESLSELTSAVAMSRCQDKLVTHRWLGKAGFPTPAFQLAGSAATNRAFLERWEKIVVKPANGEQGKGITVGVEDSGAIPAAIKKARRYCDRVVLESYHPGLDLRVIVINEEMVAAAIRRRARIVGDGQNTAKTLIEKQSRRRSAATEGESRIPIDDETEKCLAAKGYALSDTIPLGESLAVRKTANLHTGGTLHDVTAKLHPTLKEAAENAAQRLGIPVVGLDFIIEAADQPDYVIIEANERPGLANHEPQPTASCFVDLLFPLSISAGEREPKQATAP
ncbi:MAG: N-acetylglutaminylglutamine synthetase [Lysobacterales bacterium]